MPIHKPATAYYDINLATYATAYYDILASAEWNWVVQIKDKYYNHYNFYNGKIVHKLQQIHTFSAVFHDLSTTDLTNYIKQGNNIRVLVNDRVVFTGEITRIIKTDNTRTWTIECNSLGIKLKNKKVTTLKEWQSTTSDDVIRGLIPNVCWEGDFEVGPYIDYKSEYSDILGQVANICQQSNFEWDTYEDYIEIVADSMSDLGFMTQIDFTDATINSNNYIKSACDLYHYFYIFAMNNSIKNYGGLVNIWSAGNTFLVTTDPGVPASTPFCPFSNGDSGTIFRIYADYKLDYKDYIGRDTAVDTLKIGREVISAERTNDTSRIYNKIVVPGQSSGSEAINSVYSANTITITEMKYSEAYLTNECTAGETTLKVSTTTALPNIGMVWADSEQIHYSGKTSTTLTGCSRGMNSTTPAVHIYGTPIVSRDFLPAVDSSIFPASGQVWVGMEKIEYQYRDVDGFWDLTRGYTSSTVYNHAAGIHIRDAQYTDESWYAEAGSSVDEYGTLENVVPSKGGQNRNALDFYAQSQVTLKGNLKEWGTVKLVGPTLRNELTYGDRVLIEERDSATTTLYRIMGMTWDMMKALVTIEFGDTEEWVLDKLANIDQVQQQATIKSNQPQLGTVTQVSASGKTAYVTLDSGEMKIVRIK